MPTWVSLLAAIALALIHLFAYRFRYRFAGLPRSVWLSIAGGVPVGYVFLILLPTLAEDQQTVAQTVGPAFAFLEKHVYILTLVGLLTFYSVERVAKVSPQREGEVADTTTVTGDLTAFWVSIGSFSLMNAIIGYLLLKGDRPFDRFLLFLIAIALKFVVNDFGLYENHKEAYDRIGRWVVAGAVVAGWAIAAATEIPPAALSALRAFLAGGIIMNVIKEELPEERQSRVWPFVLSAAVYAALAALA